MRIKNTWYKEIYWLIKENKDEIFSLIMALVITAFLIGIVVFSFIGAR